MKLKNHLLLCCGTILVLSACLSFAATLVTCPNMVICDKKGDPNSCYSRPRTSNWTFDQVQEICQDRTVFVFTGADFNKDTKTGRCSYGTTCSRPGYMQQQSYYWLKGVTQLNVKDLDPKGYPKYPTWRIGDGSTSKFDCYNRNECIFTK